jgi:hypothetical protein
MTRDLETIIYEAVGAASVCWVSTEGLGLFDSDQAKLVADRAIAEVRELYQTNIALIEINSKLSRLVEQYLGR